MSLEIKEAKKAEEVENAVNVKNAEEAENVKNAIISGGFRAEWDNIFRLYRLQLVQRKLIPTGLFLCIIGFIAAISIFSQVSLIRMPDDTDYIRGIGGIVWIYLLMFMYAVSDYNILSAENIGIYPGTVRTRFISRLLIDYTMFSVLALCSIISRLFGVGVTNLLIMLTGNDGYVSLFDFKSLMLRAVTGMCYMLMIHSVYILLFVTVTKTGMKKAIISLVIIFITVGFLLRFTPLPEWVVRLAKFYICENLGFANVFMRTVLTTIALLIFSFAIMSTIHIWRELNKNGMLAFSIIISYLFIIVLVIGSSIILTKESYSTAFPEENLEAMVQNKELIVRDYRIQAGLADGELLRQSCTENESDYKSIAGMNAKIAWMNLKKALKRGMIPKDTTLSEGEMLVRIVSSTYKYKEKYLYENFIEGVNFGIANGKCTLNIDENVVFYDDFLSVVDTILGDDVENMDNFGEVHYTIENCQIYVIFNKGDIKNPKKLKSSYGCYVD